MPLTPSTQAAKPAQAAPLATGAKPKRRFRLSRYAPLLLVLLFAGTLALGYWLVDRIQQRLLVAMASQGAELQTITLTELRSLYTAEVVERVRGHGVHISHDYRAHDNAIPLPATLTIELGDRVNARGSDMHVRLYSDYPFPWRKNGGPRDQFERDALLALRANPEQAFVRLESYEGQNSIRFAVADRMRKDCLDCHNSHPDSPKKDWRENDVRGVLEVIRPVATTEAVAKQATRTAFAILAVAAAFCLGGFALLLWWRHQNAVALHRMVVERTQELSQRNEELEQFAYVASHDLQEPLRMVTSYLQLIDRRYKDKLDSDGHEFIGYAVDGGKRMQTLINDLLQYSRLGTRSKAFAPVALPAVLSDVLANLETLIRETQAEITFTELPTVLGDRTQLGQVLQNLIGNAIKFRSEEPPHIVVGCERDNEVWHLTVQDNGIGIDSQYFERIFQVFQRLHTRDRYPGTGIGLAIVRKIIERHGGRIWVESVPGAGTTFHFSLPVLKE